MREIIIAMIHNHFAMVEQLQGTDRSCMKKLNIVNHFDWVTIIGQIKPWWMFENNN